ncbi:MAG: nucleotide excision repair endonuclease [Acidimicrobiales bacterium]|nr:nucleotide excision repair endonuclease [Acidimicrobiales bacterium]
MIAVARELGDRRSAIVGRVDVRILSEAAERAPDAPGVYFLLGHDGELLYVGKAGRLRRRLRQHGDQEPSRLNHRQLTLYQLVRSVRWEELRDEPSAADREADLIIGLQPRFNASYRDEGRWNYVVIRPVGSRPDAVRLELSAVSSRTDGRIYGCFAHLGRGVSSPVAIACSDGYTATLRLLWAASSASASTFPGRITRSAPDTFEVAVDPPCQALLHRFLSGTSEGLLAELSVRASGRPEYLQPSLAQDRRAAAAFYARGPAALRRLRLRHGRPPGPLSRDAIVSLLLTELRASIGDFELPRTELG